jgi:amino acid adenylation domain-containing protein
MTSNLRKAVLHSVAEIIENVSGLDFNTVTEHEHFVEIGLHSLLLIQVANRLKITFDVDISLRQLLEDFPNVAQVTDHLLARMNPAQRQACKESIALSANEPAPVALSSLSSASASASAPAKRNDAGDSSQQPLGTSPEIERASISVNNDFGERQDAHTENSLRILESTEAQREMWVAAQMSDDANCAFNESVSLHLRGKLNREALIVAVEQLQQRHETLRTVFSRDGRQVLLHETNLAVVHTLDLSRESPGAAKKAHEALRAQTVAEPFALATGPLVRFQLIIFSDVEHVLIITCHHGVCDGLSITLLARDLGNLYSIQFDDACLPPASGFTDYAKWERSSEIQAKHQASLNYWREKFPVSTPYLELPLDKPRPPVRTYRAQRIDYPLSPEFVDRSKKLAANHRVTLVSVLMASFAAYTHRLTGHETVIFGVPFAGQLAKGDINLAGHCVNLLPMTINVSGDQTFAQLLAHVQEELLRALENQYLTFGTLLQRLNYRRDPSRPSLLSMSFNVDIESEEPWNYQGLEVDFTANPRCFEVFDSNWNFRLSSDRAVCECTFNTDLWHNDTILNRLEELETFFNAVLTRPEGKVSQLAIIPAAEQALLMQACHGANIRWRENHLAELLNLPKYAGRTAVNCGQESLDYTELEERSNRLANHLLAVGVQRNDLLGVLVERSVDMLVSLLATWKAGAAYVPLDPNYPADRLLYMAETAQLKVLITGSSLTEIVADYCCPRVCLDRDAETIARQSEQVSAVAGTGEDPAYVIFTSGSTGKPKGVQVPHRAVVNFLSSMADKPGMQTNDHLLAVTTLSFDIAVLELYLPLLVGAQVTIASRDATLDGTRLLALIDENNINVMQATPSTWRLLLASGWQGGKNFKVLCGGEAFPPDLARQLGERVGEVWNMYGPTECTVWSTCHPLKANRGTEPVPIGSVPVGLIPIDLIPIGLIPIGKAIANTQCYVLDKYRQQLPAGVPGELVIGGEGLASGYLGRPDLTAERFIENPLGAGKLYRTGDQAKWRTDGYLECLGRFDNQIKLRGFRIELGEIEAVFSTHPDVIECAATVKHYSEADQRLVAYARLHSGRKLNSTEMRRYLRGFLPDYMIPQLFLEIDELPLTPNGKIDRNKLPDPMRNLAPSHQTANPQSATEKELAAIWSRLLQREQENVNEIFFDVGGHSLLALDMIASIEERFSVHITPLDILLNTLEQIAAKIDDKRTGELASPVTTSATVGKEAATHICKAGIIKRLLRLQSR